MSLILAIESSCDESAVAVVRDGREILSNIVFSQMKTHEKYGGVVPEVASRIHVEKISEVVKEAISVANISMQQIDAIAVTQGPGLVGSLHVGMIAAKTLAWLYQKPLIPIQHIAGHIYANEFVTKLQFPLLALVVSGGHTELVYMKQHYHFEVVAQTQDDAIGEAYDKVAKVLGLPYPGGPHIDRIAKQGKPHYTLPVIKTENPMDFSFSGLKSAVIQLMQRLERKNEVLVKEDLAYAFQEGALNELMKKVALALEKYDVKHVVLAGGVAANSRLRELFTQFMEDKPQLLTIPPLYCCTDNAAMIAAAAHQAFERKTFANWDLKVNPSLNIGVFNQ